MHANDKQQFIDDLCTAIAADLKGKVLNGAIPQEWNGIELRMLLAEKFESEAFRCKAIMGRKGLRDYRNTVLVKNL